MADVLSRSWVFVGSLILCVLAPGLSFAADAPKHDAQRNGHAQDLYGDSLPPGAVLRLGTVRFRHGEHDPTSVSFFKGWRPFGVDEWQLGSCLECTNRRASSPRAGRS